MSDVIKRDTTTFSFEFFPPSSDKGWETLETTIEELTRLGPSFVSVTYGAGGSTRTKTHELVRRLKETSSLDPVPHLTCVEHDSAQIHDILNLYAEAGISNILALRGDAPSGATQGDSFKHFPYAADLIRTISEFNRSGVHPDPRGFSIGAAGFPEGHPETPNTLAQMDHLKSKVDEGVDWICSQMFFDNRSFLDWQERCRLKGIDVPIFAGIMPVTSLSGLKRMAQLAAGTNFPAALLRALDRAGPDPENIERVGIHWATEQCLQLMDEGVQGIHFYTLNKSKATVEIFKSLGVSDSDQLRGRREPGIKSVRR